VKVCTVKAELFHADGQTDMMKLTVAFRNLRTTLINAFVYVCMYVCIFLIAACSITGSNTTCLNVIFTITEFRTITLIVAHYEVCLTCLAWWI
jgi:hypothetical protein